MYGATNDLARGTPQQKGRQRRVRPDSPEFDLFPTLEQSRGGESIVTFTDLVAYLRARFNVEEGQTMAEYGVVLAVITGLVVIAIGALSGAIAAALDTVRGYL
jgi:Flp pilus assembly pilin Flp